MKILIGVTGSIAALLSEKLALTIEGKGCEVGMLCTDSAVQMYKDASKDINEFDYYVHQKSVLHIDLRNYYDIFLIAPLSANTLAKISNGLCDNILTNVARCWDYSKPMILAPAMNTMMWDSPITRKQLSFMEELGATVVDPVVKTLACGDTGMGALAPIEDIVKKMDEVCTNRCFQ